MHEQEWRRQLKELASGKVLFDECMDRHTSIGVGGRADALAFPESVAELGRIVSFLRAEGIAVFFVGNGTNLIVRDDGFRGVIVSTKGLRAVRVEGRSLVYIETVSSTTLEMKNNFILAGGVSFFFPSMH